MRKLLCIAILLYCFSSCIKIPLPVEDNATATDPNISYFDNYEIELSTYKLDSFVTSGTSNFTVGYHKDPLFGTMSCGTYAQIDLPPGNPVKDKTVSFDSLVLIVKPTGEYYGDTLMPFKLQVHRLLEKIVNDDDADNKFYNPRKFLFNPSLLGTHTSVIRPLRGSAIKIRLSDLLGQELLLKLKNDNTDIEDNNRFVNYFKGIYLTTDTLFSKTVYHFKPDSATSVMRLHYHLNGTFFEEKYLDFPLSAAKHFNHIEYNPAGTNLSVFTAFKKQLKKSSLTGNKAYLHSNVPSSIKVRFPSILQLKELYPYVKVMKAELVITPSPGTYRYPYQLPNAMYLYTTDDNNALGIQLQDNFTQSPLTGNLYVDELYGDKTKYTYDITNYVNSLVEAGPFSKSALMLAPAAASFSTQLQRLVINNQSLSKGIQLKLYLLGL
jgi:Domain of unknown function (DUF4270)